MKYYCLSKNYKKKLKNHLKEFCFDKISYHILEDKLFYKRMKGNLNGDLIIYFIKKGYESDIIVLNRLWLIKKKIIDGLKRDLGEKRINEQMDFLKVYLLHEKYILEGLKFEKIIKQEKNEDIIKGYYIMKVKNYISRYLLSHYLEEKNNKIDIVLVKERNNVIFNSTIMEILKRYNLGIYDIEVCYET